MVAFQRVVHDRLADHAVDLLLRGIVSEHSIELEGELVVVSSGAGRLVGRQAIGGPQRPTQTVRYIIVFGNANYGRICGIVDHHVAYRLELARGAEQTRL